MSRWNEAYGSDSFKDAWAIARARVTSVKLDHVSTETHVTELARLRKVVAYLDTLMAGLDPELVPLSTWNSFREQSIALASQLDQFSSSRDVSNLNSANDHADNLISYLRPYMVATGRAAKALREAAVAYSSAMREQLASSLENANEALEKIKSIRATAAQVLGKVEQVERESVERATSIGGSVDKIEGWADEIQVHANESEAIAGTLQRSHTEIVVGTEEAPAIRRQITDALESAQEQRQKLNSMVARYQQVIDDLDEFHTKMFGGEGDSGGDATGFAADFEAQQKRIADFESSQISKFLVLAQRIENLLPGATSAGLASAYRSLKESFDKPIVNSGRLFYFSIALLIGFSLFLTIETFDLSSGFTLVKNEDWLSVLRSFATKAPFYVPLAWLAFYASKRRSEFQRLQQEYAHKEAVAKSYESFKKQIDELGGDNREMMQKLMLGAIETISHNASNTLDSKHGEKLPSQHLLDVSIEKILASPALTDKFRRLVGN